LFIKLFVIVYVRTVGLLYASRHPESLLYYCLEDEQCTQRFRFRSKTYMKTLSAQLTRTQNAPRCSVMCA